MRTPDPKFLDPKQREQWYKNNLHKSELDFLDNPPKLDEPLMQSYLEQGEAPMMLVNLLRGEASPEQQKVAASMVYQAAPIMDVVLSLAKSDPHLAKLLLNKAARKNQGHPKDSVNDWSPDLGRKAS